MQNLMTMNNYAPKGTKVTPTYENGKPINGYDYHKELIEKHLKEDGIYTVDYTEVENWSTRVYLIEFPGIPFNSVNFKEV